MDFPTNIEQAIELAKSISACDQYLAFLRQCDSIEEVLELSSGQDWVFLLCKHPDFADRCDWSKLSGCDWVHLLSDRPEFADRCDWSKLGGCDWRDLLLTRPEFADRCDWSKLGGCDWRDLLLTRPEFADRCDWSRLLLNRSEFAALCKKNLTPIN